MIPLFIIIGLALVLAGGIVLIKLDCDPLGAWNTAGTIVCLISVIGLIFYPVFGPFNQQNRSSGKIEDYLKMQRIELKYKCEGISTQYESDQLREELYLIVKDLRDLKKNNASGWDLHVSDDIDTIHILTDEEIDECVKIKLPVCLESRAETK
jgi:hypothetical protein